MADPIAQRLRQLSELLYEEDGRDLDAGSVKRAVEFVDRFTDPQSVSADSTGAVYFAWRDGSISLSVRFAVNGETHWAGFDGSQRPYGSGDPDPALWPFLRVKEPTRWGMK